MPLSNPWWEQDPSQRFWLEITNRVDLGANLLSPKAGTNGKPTPGYEAMAHVRAGDIVLHYWQQPGQEPAIVAWSEVVSEAVDSTITWVPHGKNAHKAKPVKRVAWEVALGGMTDLSSPVTLETVRGAESQLRDIQDSLESKYGKSVYFPFSFYGGKPLRAAQAYLIKFPKELLDVFVGLNEVAQPGGITQAGLPPSPSNVRQRTSGYVADPKLRKAIELQAMEQATAFLVAEGYSVEDVSAKKPYDLHGYSNNGEIRVEVKGSSGSATTVELTIGEVNKAFEDGAEAALIVVDQIPWKTVGDAIHTSNGEMRIWRDWSPEDERLQPIRFRYLLPPK